MSSSAANEPTGDSVVTSPTVKAPEDQDLYEVKHTKKGYGAYALKHIKPGTRLLAESPLLRIDQTVYLKADVEAAYAKLSSEDQQRYFELHSAHGQNPKYWPKSINPTLPKKERQRIEEQHEARIAMEASAASIFRTNCMDIGKGAAVFYHAARFNHSCNSNAYFSWNSLLGMETIHTVKEIKAGEEITLCYIDSYQDKARRAWEFMHYGFVCDCPACGDATDSESFAAKSADNRFRLTELEEMTAGFRFSTQVMLSNDRMLRDLLEMAKLHLKEEFVTQGLAAIYRDIAIICEAKRDTKHALRAATKALQVIATCCGGDCKEWQEAMELVQRLKAPMLADNNKAASAMLEKADAGDTKVQDDKEQLEGEMTKLRI